MRNTAPQNGSSHHDFCQAPLPQQPPDITLCSFLLVDIKMADIKNIKNRVGTRALNRLV
jgi:hypothetical protein